jgi:hypothetical protein
MQGCHDQSRDRVVHVAALLTEKVREIIVTIRHRLLEL